MSVPVHAECPHNELDRGEAAPREGEQRFGWMLEMLPVMVWTAGPDGSLTYLNARMREYLGPDLGADSRRWAERFVHPDDRRRCAPIWRQALLDVSSYEVEIRIWRSDNLYRWCLTRAVPHRDASGSVLAWLGVTIDIHDLKLAREQDGEAAPPPP